MISDRRTLILYSAAICNLNCHYCYIDKNPALKKIDEALIESFKSDYYKNFINEIFPNPFQLEEIQTWGGEPFLGMSRILPTLKWAIDNYPNLNRFMSSSNCAFEEWPNAVKELIDFFGESPSRKFEVRLQISLDGPEHITDFSRGEGVFNSIFKNIELLMELLKTMPPNVNLKCSMKPTLDTYVLYQLRNAQDIINYYKPFDNLIDLIRSYQNPQVTINTTIPNFAAPSICTVADGRQFAKLCQITRALEGKVQNGLITGLKYHNTFTPFGYGPSKCHFCQEEKASLHGLSGTCGTGKYSIGLLPNRMVSFCHEGFTGLSEDYCKLFDKNNPSRTIDITLNNNPAKVPLLAPASNLLEVEELIEMFYANGSSATISTLAAQIVLLANAGLIDAKYQEENNAIRGAYQYRSLAAFCIRDNLSSSGTLSVQHNGYIKLLLNGAIDFIFEKKENCSDVK